MANAMQQAQEKLNDLLQSAQDGSLIPIRLPRQIEEITQLLQQAAEEHQQELAESKSKVNAPADMEEYIKEEAHFVGHAVHELRTPMTSIRGYTDMLGAMGELNDMQKQFMGVIKTNIQRMQTLLADVSHINKIRKGTLKVEPKMDMFKNIAMKVEKEVQPIADELNRQFEMDIPQGLPLLNIDGDHLAVALTKLVENGLRYSAAETGKVTLSAVGEGGTLIIKVQDNGIGMTEEEIGQLGTIYFRGDSDIVNEFKGSGLGIPIAYGMIAIIDGTIEVDSTPGEGTTFTIRIKGMS